ncbi:MAG: peptidase [Planctomycetes bacterium]|nr:peptidase [Planctomycetota bacterium]
MSRQSSRSLIAILAAGLGFLVDFPAVADVVTMRNGMQFTGNAVQIAGIMQSAQEKEKARGLPTVGIDDNLRRTFVPFVHVVNSVPENPPLERFVIEKRVAAANRKLGSVGPVIRIEPWDERGNRVYTMSGGDGQLSLIQGITQVHPHYVKVESLQVEIPTPLIWDMRVSTNSIDQHTLSSVLYHAIDTSKPDDRLRIVRLYTQAERYEDALIELEGITKDFPALNDANLVKQQREIRQASSERLIREIDLRSDAGQHGLSRNMLENFPAEGVAGETMIKVKDRLDRFEERRVLLKKCVDQFQREFDALDDELLKKNLVSIREEIVSELNLNTLDRMADFLRFAEDPKFQPDRKVALAISGWLLGSGAGNDNMSVTSSLAQVRDLIRRYLTGKTAGEREPILAELEALEGSDPANVARLIAQMKPLLNPQQLPKPIEPGLFEFSIPGLPGDPSITYLVQLPPEYDPYRRYPCVVTLGNVGVAPLDQLRWWTGLLNTNLGIHLGQAPRQGYVVIAPQWTREHQRRYEYSATEHAACLYALRDACRKFSIDTDRVFLSGHAMGGEAAWDIGISHPDLWAGLIPIVATCDKYIPRYFPNARQLPMYFVAGELDGNKIDTNAVQWNRYMSSAKVTEFDITIVDFLGRGQEHFQEEIFRIFEWMNLHRRVFNIESFECHTMRPWDNYFWFVEIPELPPSKMIPPTTWPPPTSFQPIKVSGKVLKNNGLTVSKLKGHPTIAWLSPEIINFNQKITINGQVIRGLAPSVRTLLEDVRTRGDRQHPFWAKVEL